MNFDIVELAKQIIEMENNILYLEGRCLELERKLAEEQKLNDKMHQQNLKSLGYLLGAEV